MVSSITFQIISATSLNLDGKGDAISPGSNQGVEQKKMLEDF